MGLGTRLEIGLIISLSDCAMRVNESSDSFHGASRVASTTSLVSAQQGTSASTVSRPQVTSPPWTGSSRRLITAFQQRCGSRHSHSQRSLSNCPRPQANPKNMSTQSGQNAAGETTRQPATIFYVLSAHGRTT